MSRFAIKIDNNIIDLQPGETIVGRSVDCNIRFNDSGVSRRHLRFVVDAAEVTVEDLGSRNGTYVNGDRIAKRRVLSPGDDVRLGFRKLRLVTAEGGEVEEETTLRGDREFGAAPREQVDLPPLDLATASMPGRRTCPRCRADSPVSSNECPECGFRWRRGPASMTQEIDLRTLGREKRRSSRFSIEILAHYASDAIAFDGIARDLSKGGVFVACDLLDELETKCIITLLPDGHAAVYCSGIVRHVVTSAAGEAGKPPGMGIEFTAMDEAGRSWLEDYLANRSRLT